MKLEANQRLIATKEKKILYIDLDGTMVDFQTGIDQLDEETKEKYKGKLDDVPNIFGLMKPIKGAVKSFQLLSMVYDTYILSTAPWENPSAWSDKLTWVKDYLGPQVKKRLILTHNKHLNIGDYLVDDRLKNGADRFTGELIQFGTSKFPNWPTVLAYLLKHK